VIAEGIDTPVADPRRARSRTLDLAIAFTIFCLGTAIGVLAVHRFQAAGGQPSFYQSEFGPAVMLACGRGLHNPSGAVASALTSFLSQTSDAVDCASLPPSAAAAGLDAFQRACMYLQVTVGLVWKVTGVSWSRLVILQGILFGALAASTYGLFRLGLTRLWSLAAMVPVFLSTPNLNQVPHLRDYAKGPFLLAIMLIMGILVRRRTSPRATLVLSAVAGAVVGLGLGFRTDLVIAIVPFVIVVAFVVPALSVAVRACALAVFLIAFSAAALPLLTDYSTGNNIGPVVMLGMTEPFDAALGVEPSVYEYGHQYNDSLIFSIVNSYAVRIEKRTEGVDLATPEHGRASSRYVAETTRVFPADVVTRALAAIRMTPRALLLTSFERPVWVASPLFRAIYRIGGAVSSRLAAVAFAAVIAATLVVSAVDSRAAWLIVVLAVGFIGSTAVQFQERHFFYLQVVPWWALALLAQIAARAPASLQRVTMLHVKRAAVFAAVVAGTAGAAVLLTRAYQQRSAAQLFERYEKNRGHAIVTTERDAGSGRILLAAPEWFDRLPAGSPRIATRFIAVEFRDQTCASDSLPVTIRYEGALPELDFSETMMVPLRKGASAPTRLFFAAYDRPDDSSRFRGLVIAKEQSGCIAGISDVDDADDTPLLLTAVLAPAWRREALYQRLR
jgi:hypothetical protein